MALFRGRRPSPAPRPVTSASSPVPPAAPPGGGDVYGAYIKSLLDYEQARKSGLDARAAAVVATAGTLVTLLFGLVAVVTGASSFVLPPTARGWLIAAVVLFVVAIALAVTVTVIPLPYGQVDFKEDPSQLWQEPASTASVHVAEAQLALIAVARRANAKVVVLVFLSGTGELLALAMLAVAVILILR
jgi:hypothetical protein